MDKKRSLNVSKFYKLSVSFSVISVIGKVFKSQISSVVALPHWFIPLAVVKAQKFFDLVLSGSPQNKESNGGSKGHQDHDDDASDGTRTQPGVDCYGIKK